jgi:hypothetical protein
VMRAAINPYSSAVDPLSQDLTFLSSLSVIFFALFRNRIEALEKNFQRLYFLIIQEKLIRLTLS